MSKQPFKLTTYFPNFLDSPTPIQDLPNITSLLFPPSHELLPNTTELFELEFAFYESNLLSKEELVKRGGFFKSVDGTLTNHYLICSKNSPLIWEGRSEYTKAFFKEGRFSTGYSTHGLFPYRGKFHPQLIKGILNLLQVQPGETVLDPMCGSGTLNVEASLMEIDSIGIEKSPFVAFMAQTKCNSLKTSQSLLNTISANTKKHFSILKKGRSKLSDLENGSPNNEKSIVLLAFLDAMGYARRTTKTIEVLYPRVMNRYLGQIGSAIQCRKKLNLKLGKAAIKCEDARKLSIQDNSIDAIITSPPYSFAIDYAENDRPQLEYLGLNVESLKREMLGLRGKNRKDKLENYFEDMRQVLSEMYRVLKKGKYAVIVIGSNDIQTKGIRLEKKVAEMAMGLSFILDKEMLKPIKGIRNTMSEEYILFLRKR